jgi:hypothetical protein
MLFSVLYLVAPFLNSLLKFFFTGTPSALVEKRYQFEKRWKKYVIMSLGICIPLLSGFYCTYLAHETYTHVRASIANQKLYDVTYFITKDTLAPLLTDTLRWKRFAITSRKSVDIYNMQDHDDTYSCDMDTSMHTCRMHDNSDSAKWDVFHYFYPQKNSLQFTGPWKGTNVTIVMKEVPIDSMALKKERLAFLSD